jgi:hypothetical protein
MWHIDFFVDVNTKMKITIATKATIDEVSNGFTLASKGFPHNLIGTTTNHTHGISITLGAPKQMM